MSERWYVVHSEPNRENVAYASLSGDGFETFLPRFEKTIRHARQEQTVSRPLFPGYLFVAFDAFETQWGRIRLLRGVSCLIAIGGFPLPVRSGEVEQLRDRCERDGGTIKFSERTPEHYREGQHVRIAAGPLIGFRGIVTTDHDGKSPCAELKLERMFGGTISAKIATVNLVPISDLDTLALDTR